MRWLWLPLLLIGTFMVAVGVFIGRHEIVLQHARALCTACIGLE